VLLSRFVRGTDPDAGFRLLLAAGDVFCPTYRFLDPRIDWFKDPFFERYLARFGEHGQLNMYRRWMLYQLLRLTRDIPGDTVECGSFRGAASWLIATMNEGSGKTHHIFDSFEGLSAPGPSDGDFWSRGSLSCDEESVRARMADVASDVRYYKGWIPTRFHEVADRRFSFVHVDVDLEAPTIDSVRFFYDRLVPGAVLVCDDYGFSMCPGATRAIDDFLADKPERMLALPNAGGFFIKDRATAERLPG
jgi:O-methyltransferase